MEAFQNMNKKTKIILSFVGIAAVLVPAVLLMLTSSNSRKEPVIDSSTRQIDQINVGDQKNVKSVTPGPTPVSATPPSVSGGVESTPASR